MEKLLKVSNSEVTTEVSWFRAWSLKTHREQKANSETSVFI